MHEVQKIEWLVNFDGNAYIYIINAVTAVAATTAFTIIVCIRSAHGAYVVSKYLTHSLRLMCHFVTHGGKTAHHKKRIEEGKKRSKSRQY